MMNIKRLFFINLHTPNIRMVSIFGLLIILAIVFQCVSGIMVAFSLVSDPMLIPLSRDEEDIDDLYTDDFFWIHERGVDIIFMLMVFHLLRKLYLNSFSERQELAWKSGAFLFLMLHVVIFFGLVLCGTHLSDITLTIAANIVNTLTFKYGKVYWFLFTDQTLNTDTVLRAMYIHYILGLMTIFVAIVHAISMHYDYKDHDFHDGLDNEKEWVDFVFRKELFSFIGYVTVLVCYSKFFYDSIEPLSYEVFMWGDVGFIVDVRFLGVAPHWYFRSYMGWLLICPHHYFGVFGLIYLMLVIYFQPNLKKAYLELAKSEVKDNSIPEVNASHIFFYSLFIISLFYTNTFLPYGRFYNHVGGNDGLMWAYIYVLTYLTFPLNYFFHKILTLLEKQYNTKKRNLFFF